MAEVRALYARRGWSRAELSRQAGIPKTSLEKLNNGKMVLDVDQLDQLATVLDTTAAAILDAAYKTLDQ